MTDDADRMFYAVDFPEYKVEWKERKFESDAQDAELPDMNFIISAEVPLSDCHILEAHQYPLCPSVRDPMSECPHRSLFGLGRSFRTLEVMKRPATTRVQHRRTRTDGTSMRASIERHWRHCSKASIDLRSGSLDASARPRRVQQKQHWLRLWPF